MTTDTGRKNPVDNFRFVDLAIPPLLVAAWIAVLIVLIVAIPLLVDKISPQLARDMRQLVRDPIFRAAIILTLYGSAFLGTRYAIGRRRLVSEFFQSSQLLRLVVATGFGIGIGSIVVILDTLPGGFHSDGFQLSLWKLLLNGLITVIAAPIVEELYFRGLLLSWLRQHFSTWKSVIMNSVLFSLAHFRVYHHADSTTIIELLQFVVIGLICSIEASKRLSLWGPIAIHASCNAVLLVALYALSLT